MNGIKIMWPAVLGTLNTLIAITAFNSINTNANINNSD